MKIRISAVFATVVLAGLAGCTSGQEGPLVARAADHQFTVDEAARLLAPARDLPAEDQVVEALANLWVDYTLLARAVADDTTLAQLDLAPVLDRQFQQEMVLTLRDSVIRADTTFTDDQLRALFDTAGPAPQVRARHILLTYPQGAPQAVRDSVRAEMEQIRRRIVAGADFAELAREWSQDPGSASQGGDLGLVSQGDFVRPFDEAAFSLEPGVLSEVVETPYGYHLIRIEERVEPVYEEVQQDFRSQMVAQRQQVAESIYIADLEQEARMEMVEGGEELVRSIARDPESPLAPRARDRAVMRYEGGALTVGEVRDILRTRDPQFLQNLVDAPDEAIEENFLRGLTQRELLVARAREAGLAPSSARRDSVEAAILHNFREAARQAGLAPLEVRGTETIPQAVDRTVETLLQAIVQGQQQLLPLAAMAPVLRSSYDYRIFDAGVQQGVEEIQRLRGPSAAPATPPATPPAQELPADTAADTVSGG